jgi:hypothetical protein
MKLELQVKLEDDHDVALKLAVTIKQQLPPHSSCLLCFLQQICTQA